MVRPKGFEPLTSGLGSGSSGDASVEPVEDLEQDGSPAYRQAYRNDEHDLARVVTAWPHLPEHIRAAILALVDVSDQNDG